MATATAHVKKTYCICKHSIINCSDSMHQQHQYSNSIFINIPAAAALLATAFKATTLKTALTASAHGSINNCSTSHRKKVFTATSPPSNIAHSNIIYTNAFHSNIILSNITYSNSTHGNNINNSCSKPTKQRKASQQHSKQHQSYQQH